MGYPVAMRLLWPLLLAACSPSAPPPGPPEAAPPVAAPTVAVDPSAPVDPSTLPAPDAPRYAATHVVVSWKGAVDAPAELTRTRAQALELARALHGRALAGEALESLARAHSDGPSAPRGGDLGVYATGTFAPAFEAAVASAEVGAIGPLVETPFGWHIVRRDAVVEGVFVHILVSHADAWRTESTRSPEEARARLQEALGQLRAGVPFEDVARAFSDAPDAEDGGRLGLLGPGQLPPAIEHAAFALQPGETSRIVPSPYGLHVIRRLAVPADGR